MALFGAGRRERRDAGQAGALAAWVKDLLLRGRWPTRDTPEWSAFVRLEDLAAVWHRCERELLAEWIAENAGTRPASWWRYQALEARRVIQKPDMIFHPTSGWNDEGVPLVYHRETFLYERPFEVESQATYLKRLKLLQHGEAGRIPRDAWQPERRGGAVVTCARRRGRKDKAVEVTRGH